MSNLIVSSIQMGANIDYAIVISSRFLELKEKMSKRDAMIETLDFAFPTIITSGTMMVVAGILIGQLTSNVAISGIGQSLGRGTIISIIIVMFVLPQLLLVGERIIDRTSFSVRYPTRRRHMSGRVRVDGMVFGEINGTVSGIMHTVVDGDVNLNLISGNLADTGQEHTTYVANNLHGIDRIDSTGRAERVSYDQLMSDSRMPERFASFTLTFFNGDELLKSVEFEYGDSFGDEVYPECPSVDGSYCSVNICTTRKLP